MLHIARIMGWMEKTRKLSEDRSSLWGVARMGEPDQGLGAEKN